MSGENNAFILENFTHLLQTPEDVDRLESFILKLAVQGKLVIQNPEEEALILVKKIAEKKKNDYKQGIIPKLISTKKKERDEKYKVPDSWIWSTIGDISLYIQRGKSPKYSEKKEIPVISQKCIQWAGFSIEKARFIDPNSLDKYQKYRFLQNNDMLWNSTGMGTLGRVALYKSSSNPYHCAVADSHVTIVRVPICLFSPNYLYIWCSSPFVQNEIEEKATGSTKQTELSITTIYSHIIPVPPLEEQERIVARVEELFAQTALLKQKLQERDEIRTLLSEVVFSS